MIPEPQQRYHKGQPVWWDLIHCKTRPSDAPKGREWQAGWIKEVNYDQKIAFVGTFNEERKEEVFAVPLDLVRPRELP